MAGDTQNRSNGDLRPDQPTTGHDSELARQARQAENRSGYPQGGELEPADSRNITGVGGGGTGTPGGADQQEGAPRWSGDAQQPHDVAARQPDATTAAGQQPGIDRREIEAEQQGQAAAERSAVWSGDAEPNPAAGIDPTATSPEAQHMASAHVPGFDQRQQGQDQGQGGQSQSAGGMSQSTSGQNMGGMSQQTDPNRQGFVDQQSASLGGTDQQDAQRQLRAQQVQQQQQQSQQSRESGVGGSGQVGDDGQIAATHGIDVAAEQPGAQPTGAYDQQAQFDAGGSGQGSGQQGGVGQQGAGSPADQVREHMEVVGADEVHLGTVDKVEGERIKLIRPDSGMGSHQGHHHYISRGLVAAVEGNRVRLSATAANAYAMEEER